MNVTGASCHKLSFYVRVLSEVGNTICPNTFHLSYGSLPEYHTLTPPVFPRPLLAAADQKR
jgi:hypothetical protein